MATVTLMAQPDSNSDLGGRITTGLLFTSPGGVSLPRWVLPGGDVLLQRSLATKVQGRPLCISHNLLLSKAVQKKRSKNGFKGQAAGVKAKRITKT